MARELSDALGLLILDCMPGYASTETTRLVVDGVRERMHELPLGQDVAGLSTTAQPPPPDALPSQDEAWPTVLIQRRALMAVLDADDSHDVSWELDQAMRVLVEQAISASDWVEHFRQEAEDERHDVRRSEPRGPLPDLSTPSHLSSR